jgi:tetratricopeptide (TPR) repeat protein
MLVPVLGFVWMTLMQQTPAADWWQYMAAPGIFACVAAGYVTASGRWPWVMPLAIMVIAVLVILTWRRAAIYQSMDTYCRAVTAEDPHAWALQNNLGIMLKRQGQFPEAVACYQQALRDNPGYVEAHINLGNVFSAAHNASAAEKEYRIAIQMRPNDADALEDLAGIYYAEGRTDEALQLQTKAAEADSRNPARIYTLGRMQAAQGRYPQAEGCFRAAISLVPESIPLRIELCQTLVAQGKRDAALKVCAEVDELAVKRGDPEAIAVAAKLRHDCDAAPR